MPLVRDRCSPRHEFRCSRHRRPDLRTGAEPARRARRRLFIWFAVPDGVSPTGAALAAFSGAITSGMGYALWYSILPRLDASTAALAQLTVPVIALAASVVLLSEPVTLRLTLASLIILGGVAFGVLGQRRSNSSGS